MGPSRPPRRLALAVSLLACALLSPACEDEDDDAPPGPDDGGIVDTIADGTGDTIPTQPDDTDGRDTVDAPDAETGPVVLESLDTLYVGGWTKVEVDIASGTPFDFEDLVFRISEPEGGDVSMSREEDFDPDNPTIMLLAGWDVGSYALNVIHQGQTIESESFEVVDEWDRTADKGPPLWITGHTTNVNDWNRFAASQRPGTSSGSPNTPAVGGPASEIHDSSKQQEKSGMRNLLVAFVEFNDATFPSDPAKVQDVKQRFERHIETGATPSGSSIPKSVTGYFQEVSDGTLTVDATFLDPIVEVDTSSADFYGKNGNWAQGSTQIASEILDIDQNDDGNPDVDLAKYDSIMYVLPETDLGEKPPCQPTNNGNEICDGQDNDCDGDIDALDSEIDSCKSGPQEAKCGDGVVDSFDRQCVGDSSIEGDSCSSDSDCTYTVDDETRTGTCLEKYEEQCDDGNSNAYDGCFRCEIKRTKRHWPQKWGAVYSLPNDNKKYFPLFKFPAQWGERSVSREIYDTAAHEFGHTLGLPDLYPKNWGGQNFKRTLRGWTIMSQSKPFAHLSLKYRLELGWLDPNSVFSFQPDDNSAQVKLAPIETLQPGSDQSLGLQIKRANGLYYYFEYRLGQSGQMGDRSSPVPQNSPGKVLASVFHENPKQTANENIRHLSRPVDPNDPNNTQDPMSPGDSFERDFGAGTGPTTEVTVQSADSNEAVLSVRHGAFKPDPSIREWPSSRGRWKSPDIRITNPKSQGDPPNNPWAQHDNTIIATVRNDTDEDAPQVSVKFFVQPMNAGGEEAPATPLGTVTQDVPANSEVEFKQNWVPKGTGHRCVKAIIQTYTSPTGVAERAPFNNRARSNYSEFWSDVQSPGERKILDLTLHNPFDEETTVRLLPRQTHPHFRTYLRHRWLELDGGETRTVQVMFEYARDLDAMLQERVEYNPLNRVRLNGWAIPPRNHDRGFGDPIQLSGTSVDVRTGFATTVELEQVNAVDGIVEGQVRDLAHNQPADGGTVLIGLTTRRDETRYRRVDVDSNGTFRLQTSPGTWREGEALYLANFPLAPSPPTTFTASGP